MSTVTVQWFAERGFREMPVTSLPPSKLATINPLRNSKVYVKEIKNDRELDTQELMWDT